MHHRGRVVSQGELIEHIYAQNVDRDSNTVEVFIARLRRKLGRAVHRDRARAGLPHRARRDDARDRFAARAPADRRACCGRSGCSRSAGIVTTWLIVPPSRRAADSAQPLRARRIGLGWSRSSACRRLHGSCASGCSPFERLRARLGRRARRARAAASKAAIPPRCSRWSTTSTRCSSTASARWRARRRKAGDLAHGLKTPLAVLAQEAERAAAAGQHELAAAHRAAGRAHAAAGRLPPGAGARRGVRRHARRPLHRRASRPTGWRARCCGSTPSAASAIDVDVSGRARRSRCSARTSTRCSATCSTTPASGRARAWRSTRRSPTRQRSSFTVDDDGPGLDRRCARRVLQRGVRADEAAPGSGFGLAIVRDLAELYGGSIALERRRPEVFAPVSTCPPADTM